ncbi:MAG TPA: RHS repeat-associated core domain-containing protein [Pyrinomonadaceae bacterium]|nr:RHS repeat-associated core domain-containing protein [Pyrinomonadaceae bacterium]
MERARTKAEVDNYTIDTTHARLVDRPNISGFDSSFCPDYVTRGNVTCITRSILVNGAVTGSVTSCRQFDIAGNVVKTIDARGFATTTEFADRFGSPNGDARSNSAPIELGGQTSYAFGTKVTNALDHVAYVQFDYYISNPVDAEDVNGIVTSGYFDDALDRPTQIRRAVGTAIQNQTTFAYDNDLRIITTTRDQATNNDNVLVTKSLYDKLGRTVESRQYEGGSNYITIQTQYDAFGRPFKVSKPFRPWQSESPVWTTQAFDALGRITTITSPDNAVVATSYDANAITVTDPKLRKRRSIMDSLGRMKHVYEDPDGLNFLTSYAYDVFDNLVLVTQGTQTRTFSYNSLGQLTSATNPENGTVSYQYDNEGNPIVRTEARNVSAHYSYDALNRPTRRWYNGSSSTGATTHNSPALPSGVGTSEEINYFYDAQSLPFGAPSFSRGFSIGRQVAVTYGVGASAGDYWGYDELGRSVLKIQRTGSVNYQTSATYNLANDTTSITYPSRRTANYLYDAAARTSNFSGNLGDGTTRTYASTFIYNSSNQITQELFGTAMPLYHKLQYNIRSQLWDVRVSTAADVGGTWNRGCLQYFYDGSYGYGTSGPDNNGNLLFANTYIPLDEQYNGWAINRQSYSYDALNRLTSTKEYFVSHSQAESQQSVQSYTYDRWGNRTINTGATNGTGVNNKAFTVNTANNRLGVPGGQSGVMTYDTAGNLTNDTYTGAGSRTYNAENKITSAWGGNNQAQLYSYDGSGQRIVRTVNGVPTWHVYGVKGELLAEYTANGAAASPQKEYGYRSGELLIVAANGGGPLIQWLVADHLGTPRIILDQTGSLANVKRHDYLPFGEELFAGTGGRTTAQGYTGGDGVRQQFTSQDRDVETGLDYFGARFYSSVQGRFTGYDPGKFTPADPQNFNRYAYVQNNPLKFIDPTGRDLYLHGSDADYIVAELERITGLRLQRDKQTGRVTIVPGSKWKSRGTSAHFANRLTQVIGDSRAKVEIETGRNQPGILFDGYRKRQLDVADYDAFKKADPKFAAESLAHVIEEYYYEQIIPYAGTNTPGWQPAGGSRGPLTRDGRFDESHEAAADFESKVLGDFTGWWEKPYEDNMVRIPGVPNGFISTFEFSSVTYTVVSHNFNVVKVTVNERKKPIKQR